LKFASSDPVRYRQAASCSRGTISIVVRCSVYLQSNYPGARRANKIPPAALAAVVVDVLTMIWLYVSCECRPSVGKIRTIFRRRLLHFRSASKVTIHCWEVAVILTLDVPSEAGSARSAAEYPRKNWPKRKRRAPQGNHCCSQQVYKRH